ncbi:MAG TPA: proton-conducting transporter membrane subunit [Bacteroidales bacterium]|nr:proton-conducting transporter membrane subunit [Bacteroidales bacterium]HQI45807.1 proton-conducting transporter membrane subunit [Bacteroidales bacterium]
MTVFFIIPVLSFLYFLLPKKVLTWYNLILTALLVGISSFLAIPVIIDKTVFEGSSIFTLWGSPISVSIDLLSAFFIMVINITVLTGAWFAIAYMRLYQQYSKVNFSLHFFFFFWLFYSMLMVCMFPNVISFLVAWEIMSISSFVLVIFEHKKKEVLKAGINYLVQMHIGALLLMVAFILIYNYTGNYTWNGLSTYFSQNENIPIFLLFFIGFGIKAGFVPFHTWLPHAHPAAPTHISGIMSGVMIKMGIYGILRVLLHIQANFLEIGIIILIISAISGIAGVGTAIIQHDLKKLLAYHSIENIGIIGIGIGVGMIGIASENNLITMLGFGGGILHVLNHSLFKSLLFYTTGSVYMNTHTRTIDHLGGLIKKMPHTAVLFLVASIAICGLPPLNGFVSEFLIYNSFAESMISLSIGLKILMMFAMLSLAVIGGLAIFCFTKAFGITFLGTARKINLETVQEVNWFTLIPQYFILILIFAIGLFPQYGLNLIFDLSGLFAHQSFVVPNRTISTISSISLYSFLFIGITILIYVLRSISNRKKPIETAPTWGCAYNGSAKNLQYTASSYAENYAHDMDKLLNQKTHYKKIKEEDIFPQERTYETHSESVIEEKLYIRISNRLQRIFNRFAFVQTGKTQHYIMYMFVLLIVLIILTIFNVI